jgi:hypothetical protein
MRISRHRDRFHRTTPLHGNVTGDFTLIARFSVMREMSGHVDETGGHDRETPC